MALASDRAIVASLSERFYRRVYAFARQLTDPATGEDITQEVFLKLMRMEDLESRVITSSYLIKMAHNLIRGRLRRVSREIDGDVDGPPPPAPDARRAAKALDDLRLDQLKSNEEAAIRLTVCQGLSLEEASKALGVKLTTVTNWKYRGLKKLAASSEAA